MTKAQLRKDLASEIDDIEIIGERELTIYMKNEDMHHMTFATGEDRFTAYKELKVSRKFDV